MFISNKLNFSFALTILLLLSSCSHSSCDDLPITYSSYDEAMEKIENSSYQFNDEFLDKESSWMDEVRYFSCDGLTGYLIMRTDNDEYLHEAVPMETWIEFKKSDSKGQFYNSQIRNQYQFVIE